MRKQFMTINKTNVALFTILALLLLSCSCESSSSENGDSTDVDAIDLEISDGDEDLFDPDIENEPEEELIDEDEDEDKDSIDFEESETDIEPDIDQEPDLTDGECIPCTKDSEYHCTMDREAGTCSSHTCFEGCLLSIETPPGRYGYCDPLPGRGCVLCDTRKLGAFTDCDPIYLNGPPELPEGDGVIDDGTLLRGYLPVNPEWSDRLLPGETRLSPFFGSDALYPVDVSEEYVTWVNWDYHNLFIYHRETRFAEQIRISDGHNTKTGSIDNDTIYMNGKIRIEGDMFDTDFLFQVNPITRIYHVLESFTFPYTNVAYIHARDGKIAVTGDVWMGYYSLLTDLFTTLESRRFLEYSHISDDKIVSQHWQSANSEVLLYVLSNDTNEVISDESLEPNCNDKFPNVSGNYATWWSGQVIDGQDFYSIYLYDITEKQLLKLETPGPCSGAWVNGENVVWGERDAQNTPRIRLYHIPTGTYKWITDSSIGGWQKKPRLFGRWLAYADESRFNDLNGEGHYGDDVMLFDLCSLDFFRTKEICEE